MIDVSLLESMFQMMGPLVCAFAHRVFQHAAGLGHSLFRAARDLSLRRREMGGDLGLGRQRWRHGCWRWSGSATMRASPLSPAGSPTASQVDATWPPSAPARRDEVLAAVRRRRGRRRARVRPWPTSPPIPTSPPRVDRRRARRRAHAGPVAHLSATPGAPPLHRAAPRRRRPPPSAPSSTPRRAPPPD